MRNTEYNIDSLSWAISSEDGFNALKNIISDLDLEIRDIRTA